MTDTTVGARWDRNRVLFEIEDAGQVISCAISREALQDASDRRYANPKELMACFERSRDKIEQVALAKFRNRADDSDSLVIIWSSDLDDPEDE
jgi:hypothetical protein